MAADQHPSQSSSQLLALTERMADTMRGVLMAAEADPPYPWKSGHLKQQIREDITDYELLWADSAAGPDFHGRLAEAIEACGDGESSETAWHPDAMIALVKMLRGRGL